MKISNSLNNFIFKLIDYAGLFPPAGLKLNDALSNYNSYSNSEFKFALSKFIIPISKLSDAGVILNDEKPFGSPLNFSLIPASGKSVSESKEKFLADLETSINFSEKFASIVEFGSIELKMTEELFDPGNIKEKNNGFSEFINFIDENKIKFTGKNIMVFYEGIMNSNWEKNAEVLIDNISGNNLTKPGSGFKLRTGGLTPEAFPDSHQIAFCIRKCLDRKVPMKFTAGLHHPFRHYDESIGTMMHGFVNLFGAGIIAMRHDISDHGMVELLDDENPDNFKFTDDYFSWKDWKVEIDDIKYARKDLVVSYGSCSFDEPIDDLKSLNFIN